jgi:hypothetical protein
MAQIQVLSNKKTHSHVNAQLLSLILDTTNLQCCAHMTDNMVIFPRATHKEPVTDGSWGATHQHPHLNDKQTKAKITEI